MKGMLIEKVAFRFTIYETRYNVRVIKALELARLRIIKNCVDASVTALTAEENAHDIKEKNL